MTLTKLLIIDDEIDYCMIMKSYFQDKDFDVSLAFTLQDGLKKLEQLQPHVLFLDNNLPDGKGWDCVEEIVEKIPQLRIYLVSAYSHESDLKVDYPNVTIWEKPISFQSLNKEFAKNDQ